MSREREEQPIGTADLLAAGDRARDLPMRERTVDAQSATGDVERNVREEVRQEVRPDARADAIQDARAEPQQPTAHEELAALFDPENAQRFRGRWTDVQSGFVDDPRQAVQHADELVAEVMQSLAQSFARQRAAIEAGVGGQEQASTENLRLALRRYRSFFERLLTL